MKVAKELTFDAAHLLSEYDGKCNNLHGHTYRIHVELTGDTTADMVMDFNDIKEYFDRYDHAIIFAHSDAQEPFEQALMQLCIDYKKKFFVMPNKGWRPTAENMASMFAWELATTHDCHVKVQVWETPSAYAEAESDNQ